jgi:hypothetical protein
LIDFYNKTVNYLNDSLGTNFILLSIVITMIISIVYFIVLGWIITRMDKRYFLRQYIAAGPLAEKKRLTSPHKELAWVIAWLKIMLAVLLLLVGVAMLFLPGQGLITILVGLSLIPFPGKRRLELFLLSRKSVRSSLNWIRIKANKDPFIFDETSE